MMMKKVLSLLLCVVMLSSLTVGLSTLTAKADTSVVIGLSPNKATYNIGDQVTVIATARSSDPIFAVTGTFTYNSAVLQWVSGGNNAGAGTCKVVDAECSGENSRAYQFTFKVIAAGDSYVKFAAECSDGNAMTSGAGGYTIKAAAASEPTPPPAESQPQTPAASNNANLSSLTVSGGNLSPKFSSAKTTYNVSVGFENETVKITAKAQDGTAKISGAGNFKLAVGANKRNIVVTAADGTKKTYTLNITRLAEGETGEEQPSDTPAVDTLAVTMGEKAYHVAADISQVPVPAAMEIVEGQYNGTPVQIFQSQDKTYRVYWLTEDETGAGEYYVFDDVRGEFKTLPYMSHMGTMYIFADVEEGLRAPDGYYETNMVLGNSSVTAWGANDPSRVDFYMLYCYVNGMYRFYSYDSLEGTLQRAPDFDLEKAEEKKPEPQKMGILERLKKMPTRGKIVLGVLLLAVLCVITLIVLLVVRAVKERRDEELKYEDYNEALLPDINDEAALEEFLEEIKN